VLTSRCASRSKYAGVCAPVGRCSADVKGDACGAAYSSFNWWAKLILCTECGNTQSSTAASQRVRSHLETLASMQAMDQGWSALIGEDWSQGRGAFGGIVAAVSQFRLAETLERGAMRQDFRPRTGEIIC
jgi:hypothetical protein